MRLPTREANRIHTVRGGYYYKNDSDMLYWFPAKGNKRLLAIYCTSSDWAEIRKEK